MKRISRALLAPLIATGANALFPLVFEDPAAWRDAAEALRGLDPAVRAESPRRALEPRVGWVRVDERTEMGSRRAVLRNIGPAPIMLSMFDGTVRHSFLTRRDGRWHITGPFFFCGTGATRQRLGVGESLFIRFEIPEVPRDQQPLRVAVWVTDTSTKTSFYASSKSIDLSR